MFTIIIICYTHDTGESYEDMTETSSTMKKCSKTLIKTVGHTNRTFKAPANAQYLNSKIIQISSAHRALRMENCFSLNSTHAVNGNHNFFFEFEAKGNQINQKFLALARSLRTSTLIFLVIFFEIYLHINIWDCLYYVHVYIYLILEKVRSEQENFFKLVFKLG